MREVWPESPKMRTVEVKIPDLLFNQALELAARENLPLDQILGIAISQALGAWHNDTRPTPPTQASDRQKFLDKLQRALEADTGTEIR
jgi:hypothetical protein